MVSWTLADHHAVTTCVPWQKLDNTTKVAYLRSHFEPSSNSSPREPILVPAFQLWYIMSIEKHFRGMSAETTNQYTFDPTEQ